MASRAHGQREAWREVHHQVCRGRNGCPGKQRQPAAEVDTAALLLKLAGHESAQNITEAAEEVGNPNYTAKLLERQAACAAQILGQPQPIEL